MKKKFTKNLKLSKKTVSSLSDQAIKGQGFSAGCSDGCTPLQTWINCTAANCTADCGGGSYPQCMPPPIRRID
jgi:hypothetical protein